MLHLHRSADVGWLRAGPQLLDLLEVCADDGLGDVDVAHVFYIVSIV